MFFLKKIKNLYKTKFIFNNPKKEKIIFYDSSVFSSHSEKFIEPYLDKNHVVNLDIRFKEIYFFILIKAIIKKGFNDIMFNYSCEFIRYVNPKLVFNFLDSDIKFYQFKHKFKDIKFLSFQTSYRSINNPDLFSKFYTQKLKNLSADYILCFGPAIANEYKKFIKCETFSIGSFKNNTFSRKKELKNFYNKKNVFFISQFRANKNIGQRKTDFIDGIPREIFYKPEKILLPILQEKCVKENCELFILGCSIDVENEYLFYKNILNNDNFKHLKLTDIHTEEKIKNIYKKDDKIDLIRSLKDGGIGSYIKLSDADLVFFVDSTLGYEALSLNHRCASFHCREVTFKNSEILGKAGFGWPALSSQSNGNFWTNEANEFEAKRIIDYVFSVTETDWERDLKFVERVISYDENNNIFRKILKKI